jgi:hypothetical protein
MILKTHEKFQAKQMFASGDIKFSQKSIFFTLATKYAEFL